MRERPTKLFVHCGRLAIILAAGGMLGTALGNFAIGETGSGGYLLPTTSAERPPLGNPDALVPDVQPTTSAYEGPTAVSCTGCDPPPFRRWYETEQQRITDSLAQTSHAADNAGHSYDRYGNVYYDDGAYDALARGLPEHVALETPTPEPPRIEIAAEAPPVRLMQASAN